MKLKSFLIRLYWILNVQFGIDPRKLLRSLAGLPRYLQTYIRFRSGYTGRIELMPCLHEWYEEGGTTKSEYFWQDLLVAREIFKVNPKIHVDIGSRVDGFVAHVASFREIEVFDIRPISTHVPGVVFKQANMMEELTPELKNYCDSLSCLHALEHFGLGRYCDPVDPQGFEYGIRSMSYLIKKDGAFYLSVPIGIERVEFNAHRIFDPKTIIDVAKNNGLKIKSISVIEKDGLVSDIQFLESSWPDLDRFAQMRYALGVFYFVKI